MNVNQQGVTADISGLMKPQALQPVIKRMGQYVKTMEVARKTVTHIDMFATHYDQALRALSALAKEHSLPPVIGLRYGEIPVTRRNDG